LIYAVAQAPCFSLIARDDEPAISIRRFGVCPGHDIMQASLRTPCFAPNGMCRHEPTALHPDAVVADYIFQPMFRLAAWSMSRNDLRMTASA
jgi:hypothetical protein